MLERLECNTFEDLTLAIQNIIINNTVDTKAHLPCTKPYIDRKTRDFIEIRNKFINLKAKYPDCIEIKTRFKYYRNLVNRLVRKSKKVYYDMKFAESINDPRRTWQNINSALYNKSHTHNPTCSLLSENGIPVSTLIEKNLIFVY